MSKQLRLNLQFFSDIEGVNFRQDNTIMTPQEWKNFRQYQKEQEIKNNRPGFMFGGMQNNEQHHTNIKDAFTTLQKEGRYQTASQGNGFAYIDQKAMSTKQVGFYNNYLSTSEGTQFAPDSISFELLRRRFAMKNNVTAMLGVYTFTGKQLRLPLDRTNFGVAIVPENGEFPINTPDTADIILEPQKLATALRLSGEFFNDVDNVAYNSLLDNLAFAFTKAEEELIIFADGTGLQATANVGTTPITFRADTQDEETAFKNEVFRSMRFMDSDYIQPENMVLIAHSDLYPYIGNLGIENVVYTDQMDVEPTTGDLPILWVNKNSVVLGLREAYEFEMLRKDNFMYRLESLERIGMELPYLDGTGLNRGASLYYIDVTPTA